jgi:serine/threonine-protein kinase
MLQACDAMIEAHARGIVHRDLKPSNLFLTTGRGGQRVLKIVDFGISKLQSEANVKLTLANASMGTPLYMSPEQVRSADVAGPASDQWALGVILYELLTGEPPFTGNTVAAVAASVATDEPRPLASYVATVPPGIEAAVRRALTKDPQGRFPDVAAFARALLPFAPSVSIPPHSAAGLPASAGQTLVIRPSVSARTGPVVETSAGTTTSASSPRRRSQPRGWVMIGVGALAVSAGSAGIATWARRPAASTTTAPSSVVPPGAATAAPTAPPSAAASADLPREDPVAASAPAPSAPAPSAAPASSEAPPSGRPRSRTSLPSTPAPPAAHTATASSAPPKPVAPPTTRPVPAVPENPERL